MIEQGEKLGVEFEAKKTELIHFHTHKQLEQTPIKVGGRVIKLKILVRWLGFFFDPKLKFNNYVNTKITAAAKAFTSLQRLSNI